MLCQIGMAKRVLAMCCVWGVMALFGCSGDDGENTTSSSSQQPPNVVPTALQEKGFRFSIASDTANAASDVQALGAAFHIQGLLTDQPVTLAFGDFNGTFSAPFTLVAGGFRASGTATRGASYILSVEKSTFPSSQTSGLQGPQVGDQITINLLNSPDPFRLGIGTDSQTPLLVNVPDTQTTFPSGNICDFITGGTINPTADGCLIVDGNISAPGSGNIIVVTVGQPQVDQVLQLSLSHNLAPNVDFDLAIRARILDAAGNTGTIFVRDCNLQTTSPEVCAIPLTKTLTLTNALTIYALEVRVNSFAGTGDYTLEVVSNPLQENRDICNGVPQTLDGGPNGSINNGFVDITNTGFITNFATQNVENTPGCLRITGNVNTAAVLPTRFIRADFIDSYTFSVGSDVESLLLVLTAPAGNTNDFDLLVFDPDVTSSGPRGAFITNCNSGFQRTEICTLTTRTSNNKVRVDVQSFFADQDALFDLIGISAPYTLDILPVPIPTITSSPSGKLPPGSPIVVKPD